MKFQVPTIHCTGLKFEISDRCFVNFRCHERKLMVCQLSTESEKMKRCNKTHFNINKTLPQFETFEKFTHNYSCSTFNIWSDGWMKALLCSVSCFLLQLLYISLGILLERRAEHLCACWMGWKVKRIKSKWHYIFLQGTQMKGFTNG